MALSLNDQQVVDWFKKYMTPEESEIYYIYGTQNFANWLRLLLGLIPGVSVHTLNMFTRFFIVGLTKQRLLIMELSKLLNVKDVKCFYFSQIEEATIGVGKLINLKLRSGENYRIRPGSKHLQG